MDLKKARNMAMASIICAAVSLFIGGVLLDIVAVILGVVAYRKLKESSETPTAENQTTNHSYTVDSVKKLSKTGIIVAVVAFVLNFVSAMYLMPMLLDQVSGISTGTTSSSTGSIF